MKELLLANNNSVEDSTARGETALHPQNFEGWKLVAFLRQGGDHSKQSACNKNTSMNNFYNMIKIRRNYQHHFLFKLERHAANLSIGKSDRTK